MKKMLLKGLLIFGLLTGFKEISHAQKIFVKIQPVAPRFERPPAPSRNHVWVEGEWEWSGDHYVRKEGYWVVPRPHEVWVTGHWKRAYGGWAWAPGHWSRPRF